jgi:CBS domain-containing membrane protein
MTKLKGGSTPTRGDIGLTDQDVYEAMKSISGYLDVTPGDFRELYCHAFRHALERISRSLLARDIMTKDVVFVGLDTPIHESAEIMGRRGFSGLPVTDESRRVVGVISEKDFLARMGKTAPMNFMTVVADCLKAKGCIALAIREKKAGDIMSSPAVTVHDDSTYSEITRLLAQRAINRMPITDGEGRLIGIITRTDLIVALSRSGLYMTTTSEEQK